MTLKSPESLLTVVVQKFIGLLVGAFLGAFVPAVLAIRSDEPKLLAFAIIVGLIGAVVGGCVAGSRIGPIGWCIASGAILGGFAGVLTFVEGYGGRLFLLTTIGVLLGFVVGIFVEWTQRNKRSERHVNFKP